MDEVTNHFLSERKKKRDRKLKEDNKSQSEKILSKTNKLNESINPNIQYRNNLSDKDFEYILRKKLVYELDDYKTNYSYKQNNNVDPEFNFNLKIQNEILDFVNNHFYSKNSIYKFMQLINETFDIAIKLFIKEFKLDDDDIRLVFYNDIILRKIAEKFIYTLPNKSSINMSGYFDTYFNSESLEWFIILHPELDNYEKIHSKLKFYIALVMKQINMYININHRSIFNYSKYNDKYKQYLKLELSSQIEQVLNNLKEYNVYKTHYEVEKTDIVKNIHIYRHDNTNVLLNNNAKKYLFQINIVEKENKIEYSQCMSFNISLKNTEFKKNSKLKIKNNTILVPIQIMSVIISNNNDIFLKKLISSDKNVRKYSYVFSLEDIFSFDGLSFKFICDHLEESVYTKEPWINPNWKHIYGRLVFFYLIDLFINVENNRVRNSIVTLSKNYIDSLKEMNKEFSVGDKKEMDKIYNTLLEKKTNTDVRIIKLIINIHNYNITYKYNVKFKEFIDFIDDILDSIEHIFESVHLYCTESNNVFEKNLYEGSIQNVI